MRLNKAFFFKIPCKGVSDCFSCAFCNSFWLGCKTWHGCVVGRFSEVERPKLSENSYHKILLRTLEKKVDSFCQVIYSFVDFCDICPLWIVSLQFCFCNSKWTAAQKREISGHFEQCVSQLFGIQLLFYFVILVKIAVSFIRLTFFHLWVRF